MNTFEKLIKKIDNMTDSEFFELCERAKKKEAIKVLVLFILLFCSCAKSQNVDITKKVYEANMRALEAQGGNVELHDIIEDIDLEILELKRRIEFIEFENLYLQSQIDSLEKY